MRKLFYGLAIVFVVLIGIIGIQESFALTCSGPTMDDEFDTVDVVFTGKVIAKEYLPTNDDRPLEKYAISTMQVDEIFKGSLNDTVKIKSDEGFWGIYLAEDWRYVIFGKISDDIVNVTSCTSSGHIPPIPSSKNIFTEDAEPRMNQLITLLLERNISLTEEKTWWLGENLKKGDYFEYSLCEIDLNDCSPINLKIWIKGTIPYESETLWDTKVVVIDGNKIIKGSMSLGKIASVPITFDDDLGIYAITFKYTVAWLASFALSDATQYYGGSQSLNEGSEWRKIHHHVGGLLIYVVGSETIKTPEGTFDSILVSWDIDETENKIWVVDEFPFPIKADVWLHTKEDVPYQWFKFELLDYREDVLEDPFQPVAYADDSLEQESEFIESPKQQMKTGILPSEVQCKEGLELIFKNDDSPACVKPATAEKLIERSWANL